MTDFGLADGTPLHVACWGEPDAEITVVLLHGYALDHRSWHAIATDLPAAVERPVRVLA